MPSSTSDTQQLLLVPPPLDQFGFEAGRLETADLDWIAVMPPQQPLTALRVYIEGDLSFWNLEIPRIAPFSLAYRLFLTDPSPQKIYLGNICNSPFSDRWCRSYYQEQPRFGAASVRAMRQALTSLQGRYGEIGFELIGTYDGGALAMLTAAQDHRVTAVRTLFAPLDFEKMSAINNVRPMIAGPEQFYHLLQRLPQLHWFEVGDDLMPEVVAAAYADRYRDRSCLRIRVITRGGDWTWWARQWPTLLSDIPWCQS
ncbi:hypothetical protein [Marinobacterium jannaschii]|uniref:hypothetical protein n=1 Tax=Marinobacterium jannaschii TaxID=64970 RepID=UPI0004850AB1|nr:hypothetical protein [Marinobacterium jannaschii]